MSDKEIDELEKQIPAVALAALDEASNASKNSKLPRVLVIGDGLYRIWPSGDKELIRTLEPQPTKQELLSGRNA